MKYFTILIFSCFCFSISGQNIEIVLTNLGEVETGKQRIQVNYRSSQVYEAADGTDKWRPQLLTIGWEPTTGITKSSPNPSSEITNVTNISGFNFVGGFTGGNQVVVFDMTDFGAADDGNVYMNFKSSADAVQAIANGATLPLFYFDYEIPAITVEKPSGTSSRFAPNEIFVLESQPNGLPVQLEPNVPNSGTGTNEFSGSQSTSLPVEFSNFTAKKSGENTVLSWETSSEINNDFFNVERSADGTSFETIGKVTGNGTTSEVQNYEFLDRTPHAGLNYYRLKQVDFNGEYEYSKVETVDFRDGTEGDVAIFPNPAVDYVNVTLDRAYDGVKVINQLGQLVESLPSSLYESNQFKLDLSAYAPGVYFLEAKLGHEIVNKQFVKVK